MDRIGTAVNASTPAANARVNAQQADVVAKSKSRVADPAGPYP